MEDNTQNTQPQPSSDVQQIKDDLANLYTHVSSALGKKTGEAREKWEETRVTLEVKRKVLEEQAAHLIQAGGAASADMKTGFSAAFSELKKALTEARRKFAEEEKQD